MYKKCFFYIIVLLFYLFSEGIVCLILMDSLWRFCFINRNTAEIVCCKGDLKHYDIFLNSHFSGMNFC